MDSNISEKNYITTELCYFMMTIVLIVLLVLVSLYTDNKKRIELLIYTYEGCGACTALKSRLSNVMDKYPHLFKIELFNFENQGDLLKDWDDDYRDNVVLKKKVSVPLVLTPINGYSLEEAGTDISKFKKIENVEMFKALEKLLA